MQLTPEQHQALVAIEHFLGSNADVFILTGYAGTGKTTLINQIASILDDRHIVAQLMAPTGRAAMVLSERTRHTATTIHRAIYKFDRIEIDEATDEHIYYFPVRETPPQARVIIVDEASMVGDKAGNEGMLRFGTGRLLNDLLTYVRQSPSHPKLIMVGDAAQLPPVGDNCSPALDVEYLQSLGLKVATARLTQVMRQGEGSKILANATRVRRLLEPGARRLELTFDIDNNEVAQLDASRFADAYCRANAQRSPEQAIIITYTNADAAHYNAAVRERFFPGCNTIQPGDIVVVTTNHYSAEGGPDLLNGDFLKVLAVDPHVESRDVTLQKKDADPITVTLSWQHLTMQHGNQQVSLLVLNNILASTEAQLTHDEFRALFVDFRKRHKHLKPNSTEFKKALVDDPYYNALRIKYGYAITGHKSQGGEWPIVFADYSGRTGLDKDSLRWTYTVTTRAARHLVGANFPHNEKAPIEVHKPIIISQVPQLPTLAGNTSVTPFHDEHSEEFLRIRYWQISAALESTPWRITQVESLQYCNRYTFVNQQNQATARVDFFYNKKGAFRDPRPVNDVPQALLDCLSRQPAQHYQYTPATEGLAELHTKVTDAVSRCGLDIDAVTTAQYQVSYRLSAGGRFYAFLDFSYNGSDRVTACQPRILATTDATSLNNLLQLL